MPSAKLFTGIYIGCAGWAIPKLHGEQFPASGSHLERYASRFPAVEINSSFYRPHRPTTYARWAAVVPEHFRFAVKVPKQITHERRLVNTAEALERFLVETAALGEKLGPLLVQLPPSLVFNADVVGAFFVTLRAGFEGAVVCEPRHASWFTPEVDQFLTALRVARVAADPALVPQAAQPGGWSGLVYYRLHGSPRIYYSAYSTTFLDAVAEKLQASVARSAPTWCIFDNTAEGAATGDAIGVLERLIMVA